MLGRAGGWRERNTLYHLTGGPFGGYPLHDDPFQNGRLAQRLERSPHTREVKGSNPLSPTTLLAPSFASFLRFPEKSKGDVCLNNGQRRILRIPGICEPDADESYLIVLVIYPSGLRTDRAPHGVRRRSEPL